VFWPALLSVGLKRRTSKWSMKKKRYINGLHRTSLITLGDGTLQVFLKAIYMDGQDLPHSVLLVLFYVVGRALFGVIRLLSLYDERFWYCRWCWSLNALGLSSLSWLSGVAFTSIRSNHVISRMGH